MSFLTGRFCRPIGTVAEMTAGVTTSIYTRLCHRRSLSGHFASCFRELPSLLKKGTVIATDPFADEI